MPNRLPSMFRQAAIAVAVAAAGSMLPTPPADARVTRIVIDSTTGIAGQPTASTASRLT
jgi:hypothetical protein